MNRNRGDRGAAAVEFALVLPLLLLLVFGIVDFGRAYHAKAALSHAAREGVRVLAFGGSQSDVQAKLDDAAHPLQGELVGVVTIAAAGSEAALISCAGASANAKLSLRHDFDYITPLPGLPALFGGSTWGSTVALYGKAEMRCGG